jgi:hypothetical protein
MTMGTAISTAIETAEDTAMDMEDGTTMGTGKLKVSRRSFLVKCSKN